MTAVIITSMKNKETLVQRAVFSPSLKNSLRESRIPANIAYLSITREKIYNALVAQSNKKALGLNRINFKIFYII